MRKQRLKNLETFDLAEYSGGHSLTIGEAIFWAGFDHWSPFEASLLLSGIDPKSWGPDGRSHEEMLDYLPIIELDPPELEKRLRKTHRTSERNRQFETSCQPVQFLIVAQRMQLSVPAQLHEAVMERTTQIPDWGFPDTTPSQAGSDDLRIPQQQWIYRPGQKNETEVKLLGGANENYGSDSLKRQTSFKKLVLGMAVERFGYKPGNLRNPSGEIKSALERAGLTIDQGTIKSLLDQAAHDLEYNGCVLDDSA